MGICSCRGGSSGGSFRRVKGKDLCLLVALLAFLFWGDVVVVVVGLGAVVRVLRTGRFVAATVAFLFLGERVILASSSAFFFRVGILLLSLAFGDPGLNLLVFAMMEIRKECSACRVRSEWISTDHNEHRRVGNMITCMVSNTVTYVNI